MSDKSIKRALIAGAFVLSLGFGSAMYMGVGETLEFIQGIVGIATDVKQ